MEACEGVRTRVWRRRGELRLDGVVGVLGKRWVVGAGRAGAGGGVGLCLSWW